jgi:hypothetical protein
MRVTQSDSIHLQSVGRVAAIPAFQLEVGMRLMWNGGSTYDVIRIHDVSPAFLEITERDTRTGKNYIRRLKKTRLVAGYWPKNAGA